ncbi:MAG TPA: response regulator, partial [Stellaceae bacterium]|nr:response regulator [Stellaceae bacterium]
MGKRILLVDDDPAVRDSVAMVLEGAGFVVDQAEQGATALRLLQAQAPDLVITDILMPQKEGIETIREIRAILPNAPIIAMSGSADTGANYLKMAESLGATATLAKPFGAKAILELVSRLLGCGASAPG